ncbi:hypothetical protein NDU88_000216 [Pleurodeles waltl]|uniref:Uncharacterized protein n=1 Tax=Pleurodeles waltl TaxID=8319 RepID=A0AAV7TE90_PLEWA|nr:hypothetical protein NDU88_000216 [Pleurodeles waltl]
MFLYTLRCMNKAILGVWYFMQCVAPVAPAQPTLLFCLFTGGRSQPSTGGASLCVSILAAAGVPTTIPLEAQARVTAAHQASITSTVSAKTGPDGEPGGSAEARQSPATAPAPSCAKQAPPRRPPQQASPSTGESRQATARAAL